ncbi:hypothetical protein SVI_3348 [Shewanella violacea DSS12]|uniref:Uncharacterized protein n=1 Tax=Shewanella violacea (strain JCM 10179 / CIP 106290 / LMG 19151 / DSS12) TaxID=637905 RepID=D4ZBC4_SHEVD|nr:hypothetical protein SVI_3348 [Shewanella violacea DSS12]
MNKNAGLFAWLNVSKLLSAPLMGLGVLSVLVLVLVLSKYRRVV